MPPLSGEVVDLAPSCGESVLDRCLGMFMPRVVRGRMINNDILVRRYRQPNVDPKPDAMAMLVTWRDNGNAASRNALIVGLEPLDLS